MKWEEYKQRLKEALDGFEFDGEIVALLRDSASKGQTIFVAGNGGSAAMAFHYVCDLSKGANKEWRTSRNRYRAVCLSSNISYITAIANDEDYSEIFTQQLKNLAKPGDILILISSSGNSPNILKAAEYGKRIGMKVVGVCGFGGGRLKELSDYVACVKSDVYEICENVHDIFGQYLSNHLRES